MRRKSDLPVKTCATCGRAFAWRRKWARDWRNVRHCSERCRRNRKVGAGGMTAPPATTADGSPR